MERSTWPELVFSGDADSGALSRAVRRRTLRRICPGVYTGDTTDDVVTVVGRHLLAIVGHILPGAVIVDRSARAVGAANGRLSVDHPRTRPLHLPGVDVIARRGPGPVEGDMPLPHGLWIASIPRQLLDNLRRSRASSGATLTRVEVEEWLDQLLAERGEDGINRLRDDARRIAPTLSREKEFAVLDSLIRGALATGDAKVVRSAQLRARADGVAFDSRRIAAFEGLASQLGGTAPAVIPALTADEQRRRWLPFYEAYFSNFIEGTEFTLDEAIAIVMDRRAPVDRPADAHDILGTYELVSDPVEMRRTPQTADEFEGLLRSRHARLLSARPEKQPGEYKRTANRAGTTEFVLPELVRGTLRRGFELGSDLTSPFARAVYLMFVVTEVHPFVDGNGRMARVMMNCELVAGGEVRIIIPTVFRANYLAALKAATQNGHFSALRAVLHFAWRYTAQVDFSTRESAEADLARTNAFRSSDEAEAAGLRLELPLESSRRAP